MGTQQKFLKITNIKENVKEIIMTSTAIELVQEFHAIAQASTKSVTIEIDTKDLQFLKQNNYKLCFAKKVGNNDYNVVWQSYTDYLVTNTFSWVPMFQLFGSNVFQDNVEVKVSTNKVPIGLGETATLDSSGVLGNPSSGGPATSITMVNDFGSIHPGVNQLSTGLDGHQISTPIYVAQNGIVQGDAVLTPVELVLVWFEQNIETSTMFSDARSNPVEIDLTNSNTATRLYTGQKWKTPPGNGSGISKSRKTLAR
ncbi:MAG: hypothetical protein GY943_09980 [Chloroflexi bacterium]|nr:hypothetical protein [Chloroflexota bacterium]